MSRDSEFCVTHSTGEGKRVPCPLNPNHTVSENRLESHLKICNRTRQSKELEQQPYYSKNINSGPPLPPAEDEGDERTDGYREPAGNTAPLDEAFVRDLIARVAVAHAEHVGHLPTEVLDPPEVQPLHRRGGTGFRKGRHVLQQASILGHMLKRRSLVCGGAGGAGGGPGSGTLHVEMGAGKGALGQAISTAFPGSAITMVERSSVRHKADKKLDGATVRARIDIRDLNMAGLPSLTSAEGEQRPVVAVAKHLCGVATDLALR
ncbi:unnamed protein product, partial [Sphacelaria rigidula]